MSEFSNRVKQLLAPVETENVELRVPVQSVGTNVATPSEWTPGVHDNEISTKPREGASVNWDDELREWGFDPDVFEVVEPVRISTWQTYDERQLWAYKALIRSRVGCIKKDELEALTVPVLKVRRKPSQPPEGSYTFVLPLGDWQIGKSDGDGLEGTVKRIETSFENSLTRLNYLRQSGYDIGRLFVASLGDLGEGCTGHYDQQTFNIEVDRRDQVKIVRRLARNLLMKLAPEFNEVIVAAVAGNHGENRKNGKSFTSNNDNDDVAIWEMVAETLTVRPELYGHIKWVLPTSELSISVQVGDKVIGLAHGHQSRTNDIGKWWQAQSLNSGNVASADILLTGHFHHFVCKEIAKDRWHIQVPAQDGGSDWFNETAGRSSTAGQVTFLLKDTWTELAIV
jgi:predicted phosphodiesterase